MPSLRLLGLPAILVTGSIWLAPAAEPAPAPEKPPDPPRPPAGLLDPRDFPVGITLLAPLPAAPGPIPIIRVSPPRQGEAPPGAPPLVVVIPQLHSAGPDPRAPRARRLVEPGAWVPLPAWPAGDPSRPYPWNPAVFSPAAPPWTPTPAWPEGQDQRNWSPVVWAKPVFDPEWKPRDSWNRKLEPPLPAPADQAP